MYVHTLEKEYSGARRNIPLPKEEYSVTANGDGRVKVNEIYLISKEEVDVVRNVPLKLSKYIIVFFDETGHWHFRPPLSSSNLNQFSRAIYQNEARDERNEIIPISRPNAGRKLAPSGGSWILTRQIRACKARS